MKGKVIMNKKERLEARKIAYKTWALSNDIGFNKQQMFAAAVDRSGLTLDKVKYYYEKDEWENRLKSDILYGVFTKEIKTEFNKSMYYVNEKKSIDRIDDLLNKTDIPDRYKMFIMYYLQSFNASQSARRAGYTKHSSNNVAHQIMNNDRVKPILEEAKKIMRSDIYINASNIIDEYIKIAFADITEFVEFSENGVKLKNSDSVDGRLITEVKQGRDGLNVKLADKMKALEKLDKLFEVMPDRRLELDNKKFELTKRLADKTDGDGKSSVTIVNDIG